jgi:hypothetical protein
LGWKTGECSDLLVTQFICASLSRPSLLRHDCCQFNGTPQSPPPGCCSCCHLQESSGSPQESIGTLAVLVSDVQSTFRCLPTERHVSRYLLYFSGYLLAPSISQLPRLLAPNHSGSSDAKDRTLVQKYPKSGVDRVSSDNRRCTVWAHILLQQLHGGLHEEVQDKAARRSRVPGCIG